MSKFVYEKSSELNFISPCFKCVHKFNASAGCKAFPQNIPDDILNGKFDHIKKYPNQDNDIVFEPILQETEE